MGGGAEFPELGLEDSRVLVGKGERARQSPTLAHASSAFQEGPEELNFWKARIEIESEEGVTSQHAHGTIFKPRKGSGVFWVNLHESGFGDTRVTHAGLPVQEGQKIGMNIWVKRDFGW